MSETILKRIAVIAMLIDHAAVIFLERAVQPETGLMLAVSSDSLYRLDRMLTQFALAGKFSEASAILLGDFSTGSKDGRSDIASLEWIWQRVLDLSESSRIPVWAGLPIGHQADNLALPLGAGVTVNSSRASLSFF